MAMPCSSYKAAAIIVAGGKGHRMGGESPKQFWLLDGRPLLLHTLERFQKSQLFDQIVLVLPSEQILFFKDYCKKNDFPLDIEICEGGCTRFESVHNGINCVDKKIDFVAIHDGIRLFITSDFLKSCLYNAFTYGSAVPALTPNESFRLCTNDTKNSTSHSIDRNLLRSIQTPQCFRLHELSAAFLKAKEQLCSTIPPEENLPLRLSPVSFADFFTDEASVMEYSHFPVNLCNGLRENIKITYPSDWDYAHFLYKNGY